MYQHEYGSKNLDQGIIVAAEEYGFDLNKPGCEVDFGRDPIALLPSLPFALTDTCRTRKLISPEQKVIKEKDLDLRFAFRLCILPMLVSACPFLKLKITPKRRGTTRRLDLN